MKSSSNIKRKIFVCMAVVGLVPLLVLAFQNHYFGRKAIEKLETEHLNYALKSRMLWLREWIRHTKKEFYRIGSKLSLEDESISADNLGPVQYAVQALFKGHATYQSLTLYDSEWAIVNQFQEDKILKTPPPDESFKNRFSDKSLLVVDRQYIDKNGNTILPIGQTILDRQGTPCAYLIAEMNLTKSLRRIMADTSDLDRSGKMYLVTADGSFLYYTSGHNPTPNECTQSTLPPQQYTASFWRLQKIKDCNGVPVFSVAAPIPEMDWILIAEVNKLNALREFQKYIWIGSGTALVILIIIVFIAYRSARNLTTPLDEMAKVTRHISEGNFQERLPRFKDQYLNDVGRSFNTMLDTLEDNKKKMVQSISLSAVGQLSSSIVHEMRNPLSSVKINLQALARKVKDDDAYAEMADIALIQVKRLESMFSDLLHFSKPIQLNMEEIQFDDLADEVQEILTQKAADKIISLEVINHLSDTPIRLDRHHIVPALINLVDNAIQWSTAGSIIQIIGRETPEGFVIMVRDNGAGLREDQFEKLFQPFYTTRENGTGLGLANVKKIVEYHGGSVLAENNSHGGAQFSMIFPKGRRR